MFRIVCRIEIEQQGDGRSDTLYFDKVNKVTVTRSYDKQTQTAAVILPRNMKYNKKNIYEGANALMRRGDKIKIIAAYHPNETVIFQGYISKINNNVPIELLCEDEMFLLKQAIAPNIVFPDNTELKTVVEKILTNTNIPYKVEIGAKLGQIRLQGANVSKVLQVLRDQYGLYSFFVDGVLRVGLAFYPADAKQAVFLFELMVKDGMNLTYLKKDDVKVLVKGIIINGNTAEKPITYPEGATEGDIRTVFQYGGTKADLDLKCNSFLEQANYTGYYGSFKTFLEPLVVPGDYAIVDSWKYPERKGKYLIKSVTTEVSTTDGGKQTIELERRIA
jgi:hypothetical protein